MPSLYVVATPIGNLEDVSLRALRTLREVKLIAAEDTRKTRRLLTAYDIKTPTTSYHEHNKWTKLDYILGCLEREDIALVSDAGMPGISDPGQTLVRYCLDNDVEYDVLPGANAVLTAFVASGFVATKMLFFGFLAHKGSERSNGLQEALFNGYTTVLYEAPHRLAKLLDELVLEAPERRLFLAKELTKKYQTYLLHQDIYLDKNLLF